MNKRVNLDALEAELEQWRGEVPLPCDVIVAMIAELRYWRDRAAAEAQGALDHPADQLAATETAPKCDCLHCVVGGRVDACVAETAPQGAPADELAELVANTCSPEEQRARIEHAKRELAAMAAPQGAPYECNCPAPYPEAVHDLTCPEHLKRFPEDAPQGAPPLCAACQCNHFPDKLCGSLPFEPGPVPTYQCEGRNCGLCWNCTLTR